MCRVGRCQDNTGNILLRGSARPAGIDASTVRMAILVALVAVGFKPNCKSWVITRELSPPLRPPSFWDHNFDHND